MSLEWLSLEDLRRLGDGLRCSSRIPDAECDLERSSVLHIEVAGSSRLKDLASDLWKSSSRC